jgi:xanthine/CO dehydrogenase XdhC/CoxF family maturation factor
MSELRAILDRLDAAAQEGRPAVLATVVGVVGSAYRRPGARLLLSPDGDRVGMVSGGCLEADVARKAWWRTSEGPVVVRYDTGAGDDGAWAFGLGCGGVVDVLLERIGPGSPPEYLSFLRSPFEAREGVALARVVGGDGGAVGEWLGCDGDGCVRHALSDPDLIPDVAGAAARALRAGRSTHGEFKTSRGPVSVCVEVIRPPVSLLICGAGPDAVPVVTIAKALGWHVTVYDTRPGGNSRGRFPAADLVVSGPPEQVAIRTKLEPGSAAVVMSHNYEDDRKLLRAILPSPVGYIGALGPRRRATSLLEDLSGDGFVPTATQLARLHAPVGLDLGSETPEEIALAVVAEAKAALAGRAGGPLRDRVGHLHTRTASAEVSPAEVVTSCPVGAS